MEEATVTIEATDPQMKAEEKDQISDEELDRFVRTLCLALRRNHGGITSDLRQRFDAHSVNDMIRNREIQIP